MHTGTDRFTGFPRIDEGPGLPTLEVINRDGVLALVDERRGDLPGQLNGSVLSGERLHACRVVEHRRLLGIGSL